MCFYVQYTCIYHCHIFLNGWIVFYNIFHDFHVYVLSHKFSEICGFVRCSNSGSLWCLTLVLQFPWGCCKPPLLLASPIPASGFCTVLGLANQERSSWAALRSQSMSHMLFCSLLLTVGSYWSSSISSTLQAPGVAGQSAVFCSQQGPGV